MKSNEAPPILVDYPLGGRHLLLHWWTQHDRGHVVLARSAEALVATTRRIFVEEPYAEIRAMMEIDVVAPPLALERSIAEYVHNTNVHLFKAIVCHAMNEAAESGLALPPPFERCNVYEPEPDVSQTEWAVEEHYDCRHCYLRIRVVGVSGEELYERCHDEWTKATGLSSAPSGGTVSEEKYRSRAPRAKDGLRLSMASKCFGDHASGVVLDEDVSAEGPLREPLFFFHRTGDVHADVRERLMGIQAVAADEVRAAARQREQEHAEAYRVSTLTRNESTVAFFAARTKLWNSRGGT